MLFWPSKYVGQSQNLLKEARKFLKLKYLHSQDLLQLLFEKKWKKGLSVCKFTSFIISSAYILPTSNPFLCCFPIWTFNLLYDRPSNSQSSHLNAGASSAVRIFVLLSYKVQKTYWFFPFFSLITVSLLSWNHASFGLDTSSSHD